MEIQYTTILHTPKHFINRCQGLVFPHSHKPRRNHVPLKVKRLTIVADSNNNDKCIDYNKDHAINNDDDNDKVIILIRTMKTTIILFVLFAVSLLQPYENSSILRDQGLMVLSAISWP